MRLAEMTQADFWRLEENYERHLDLQEEQRMAEAEADGDDWPEDDWDPAWDPQ